MALSAQRRTPSAQSFRTSRVEEDGRNFAAVVSRYEHVLIDSAPLLPVSNSVILSTLVDGVVLAADARTTRTLVRHGCSRLELVGARILGWYSTNVDPSWTIAITGVRTIRPKALQA